MSTLAVVLMTLAIDFTINALNRSETPAAKVASVVIAAVIEAVTALFIVGLVGCIAGGGLSNG